MVPCPRPSSRLHDRMVGTAWRPARLPNPGNGSWCGLAAGGHASPADAVSVHAAFVTVSKGIPERRHTLSRPSALLAAGPAGASSAHLGGPWPPWPRWAFAGDQGGDEGAAR